MRATLTLTIALALLAACGDDQPTGGNGTGSGSGSGTPAPALQPGDRLLTIDGIDVTWADVAGAVAFYDGIYPLWSPNAKIRKALDVHVLPLKLAERAFAKERAGCLLRANALRNSAGNAVELEQRSDGELRRRAKVPLQDIEIELARFVFDRERMGSVSEPIALPQGYCLAATFDIIESALAGDARADCLMVGFHTHDAPAFFRWLGEEKRRVADRVTWVRADRRTAMPDWIKLP